MQTFSDIFKKSFLQGMSGSNITTTAILITLGVTCLLSCYIFLIYYLSAKKSFYSKSFNVSLALLAVITAAIILAMQSNIVISLGMVGALSIVRFRTAVKDPKDLMFLFWSISVGIVCGAGMFQIAIITSLVITVGLFALEMTPAGSAEGLLVINAESLEAEKEILPLVKKYSKYAKIKSRNVTKDSLDLVIACKIKEEALLLEQLSSIDGIFGVSLMDHDGEVTL